MSRILFQFFQAIQGQVVAPPPLPIEALTYVNPGPVHGIRDYSDFNGHGRRTWVSRAELARRFGK